MCAYDTLAVKQITWVVVADGKRVRVYESQLNQRIVPMGGSSKHSYQGEKTDWKLTPVPQMDVDAESLTEYQLGHDHRGSIFGYSASQRHTVEPHIDIRDEIRNHLTRSIVSKLQDAHKANSFGHLVLVAPPQMLSEMKELLDSSIKKLIAAEIPKDLTKCKNDVLMDHIKDALPPLHAA